MCVCVRACVLTYASPCSSPFLGSDLYHSSYSTNICRPTPYPSNCRSFRYYCKVLVFPLLLTLEYSYIFAAMNFMCESSALLQMDPHYYKISKATSRLSGNVRTWGLVWMSNFRGVPYDALLLFRSKCWRKEPCMYVLRVFRHLEISGKILCGYETFFIENLITFSKCETYKWWWRD